MSSNQDFTAVELIRKSAKKEGYEDALAGRKQKRRTPKKHADFDIAYMSSYFIGYSMGTYEMMDK